MAREKKAKLTTAIGLAVIAGGLYWAFGRKKVEPPPPPPPGMSNIYGKVTGQNGAVIGGVLVRTENLQTTTDGAGNYQFASLEPGLTYLLQFIKEGYETAAEYIYLEEGNQELNVTLTSIMPPPPPPPGGLILDLGDISILSFNGIPFIEVGLDIDGIPFAIPEKPVSRANLTGEKIRVKNNSLAFASDDMTGLIFHMSYEGPTAGPGYRKSYVPPFTCSSPEGCPPGTWENSDPFEVDITVNSLWGGGSWTPGEYYLDFMWDKLYFDGNFFGGGDFRIKNAVQCTGSGGVEP